MQTTHTEERVISYDFTRIVALFLVVSCHFFARGDFYTVAIVGKRLFLATGLRTLSLACVPLFLMTTGCVMRGKTLCKRYYRGLFRILTIYVLACACQLLLRKFVLHETITLGYAVLKTLDYSIAYEWYVEMYLGLFLLIPFLNILYGNLQQKQKLALIITMLVLTALPGILNIFNFETPGWWADPTLSWMYNRLVPEYWIMCYPITYYLIGCYFDEYRIRINKALNLALLAVALFLTTVLNYVRSYEETFLSGAFQAAGALPIVVISVLLFFLINGVDMQGMPVGWKRVITWLSNLTFGAYLLSGFFDSWFYGLPHASETSLHGLSYYFEKVPLVFVCSLALSFVVFCVYNCLEKCIFGRNRRNGEGARNCD